MSSPYLFCFDKHGTKNAATKQSIGTSTALGFGQSTNAPMLKNVYGYDPITSKGNETKIQLINVVHDFDWTHTGSNYRHEVPYIRLSELKVNFNVIRSQLRYMLSAGIAGSTEIAKGVEKALKSITEAVTKRTEKLGITSGITKGQIRSALEGTIDDKAAPKHLRPYYGLYGVQPTGFEYVFPYFTSDGKSVTTQWGDLGTSTHGGIVSDIIKSTVGPEGFAKTLVDNLAFNNDVLGTYIERPQIHSVTDGQSHTFAFTLFNTGSVQSIVRNWHLQYMLAYQNLPNKLSKVQTDPPVIYEIDIPGIFYSPFAYIESLKISHIGSSRTMRIPYYSNYNSKNALEGGTVASIKDETEWDKFASVQRDLKQGILPRKLISDRTIQIPDGKVSPTDDKNVWTKIKEPFTSGIMIIPDAYSIEITVKSMVPESKNLNFHSALGHGTRSSGLYSVTLQGAGEVTEGARQDYSATHGSEESDFTVEGELKVNEEIGTYGGATAIGREVLNSPAARGFLMMNVPGRALYNLFK